MSTNVPFSIVRLINKISISVKYKRNLDVKNAMNLSYYIPSKSITIEAEIIHALSACVGSGES